MVASAVPEMGEVGSGGLALFTSDRRAAMATAINRGFVVDHVIDTSPSSNQSQLFSDQSLDEKCFEVSLCTICFRSHRSYDYRFRYACNLIAHHQSWYKSSNKIRVHSIHPHETCSAQICSIQLRLHASIT